MSLGRHDQVNFYILSNNALYFTKRRIERGSNFIPVHSYFTGQTDIHYSKEGVFPRWKGYAMRERAPFKEDIDRW